YSRLHVHYTHSSSESNASFVLVALARLSFVGVSAWRRRGDCARRARVLSHGRFGDGERAQISHEVAQLGARERLRVDIGHARGCRLPLDHLARVELRLASVRSSYDDFVRRFRDQRAAFVRTVLQLESDEIEPLCDLRVRL